MSSSLINIECTIYILRSLFIVFFFTNLIEKHERQQTPFDVINTGYVSSFRKFLKSKTVAIAAAETGCDPIEEQILKTLFGY